MRRARSRASYVQHRGQPPRSAEQQGLATGTPQLQGARSACDGPRRRTGPSRRPRAPCACACPCRCPWRTSWSTASRPTTAADRPPRQASRSSSGPLDTLSLAAQADAAGRVRRPRKPFTAASATAAAPPPSPATRARGRPPPAEAGVSAVSASWRARPRRRRARLERRREGQRARGRHAAPVVQRREDARGRRAELREGDAVRGAETRPPRGAAVAVAGGLLRLHQDRPRRRPARAGEAVEPAVLGEGRLAPGEEVGGVAARRRCGSPARRAGRSCARRRRARSTRRAIRTVRPRWSIVIVRWSSTGRRSKRVQFVAVARVGVAPRRRGSGRPPRSSSRPSLATASW